MIRPKNGPLVPEDVKGRILHAAESWKDLAI
jgi:hypothetical protein